MTDDFDRVLDPYIDATLEKKALDVVILDVIGLTSIADFFIICSGRSSRQVLAISEHIRLNLKEKNILPLCVEGEKDGRWVIIDYDHVIIHVFYEPVRAFYDIEGLWIDARRVKLK